MSTVAPEPQVAAPDALVAGWCARLAGTPTRVALADGDDPRVVTAAARLVELGVTPVLVARADRVRDVAEREGVRLDERVTVAEPHALAEGPAGAVLAERLPGVGADPLALAVATVPAGLAHACVAGASRPTAEVLRAALRVVGTAPGAQSVTSSFLMALPDGRLIGYGDCAVLPEPDAPQLAEVAVATSHTYATLTGAEPAVAMLSFSTKGSAEHSSVGLVREATALVSQREPTLAIDGELQFDAALLDSVGRSKANGSPVAGRANVFIFPNLAAGNIGYKITERLAGARAYGPILQGLAAPVNDLSRGCRSADIVAVSAISALQAHAAD